MTSTTRAPETARRGTRRGARFRDTLDTKGSPYLFITPFFLLFGVFGLFPLLYTAWVSLHEWSLIGGNEGWVGLENYVRLVGDAKFWNALLNTLGIFVFAIVPQLLVALGLADVLTRAVRGRGLFQMALVIPYVTSIAAMAIVFSTIFGTEYGMVNHVLGMFGIDPVNWRGGRFSSWTAIAVMVDWRWIGYNTLIYLAAMQAVPKDLYEAASLDGASRIRQFWQITVPMLRPTILFTVIISTIGQMQLFTEPAMFDTGGDMGGGTMGQFQTVMMLVFQEAFRYGDYGYGSAVSWVLFLIIVGLGLINVFITSRIKGA